LVVISRRLYVSNFGHGRPASLFAAGVVRIAIQPVALDTGVVPITLTPGAAVWSQSDEPNCGATPPTAGIGRKTAFVFAAAATEWIVRGLPDVAGFTGGVCVATVTDWSRLFINNASINPRTSAPPPFAVRHAVLQLGTMKWPSPGLNQTSSSPP